MTTQRVAIDTTAFADAGDALARARLERIAGPHVERAVDDASGITLTRIRMRASRHRRTGRMLSQIRVRRTGDGFRTQARIRSGGKVAKMINRGTAPHDLAPVNAKALAIQGPGGSLIGFAAHVRHPGTRADPFFRKGRRDARGAVKDRAQRAVEAIARDMAQAMEGKRP